MSTQNDIRWPTGVKHKSTTKSSKFELKKEKNTKKKQLLFSATDMTCFMYTTSVSLFLVICISLLFSVKRLYLWKK